MTVAIGWSGYMQRLLAGAGLELPLWMSAAPAAATPGTLINLPAVIVVLVMMVLLVVGVRESARFNAAMVAVKGAAVLFFVAVGAAWVEPENWTPFAPYGTSGMMAAAAVVFFAYIGFDAVSTTAEEAKNPRRDLPIGIIASLVVCTVLYLAVAAVLTGIVPVTQYRSNVGSLPGVPGAEPAGIVQFLNAPVAFALALIDQDWASYIVSAGAVAGITSVLLVLLLSQPRIFFAMSRDGLLPPAASKVHPRYGTPYITTIITCVIVAVSAGFTQIQLVGEMTSIGTLFAFVVVCAAVLILRVKRPDAVRPFRVAGGPVVPVLGILSCLWLMLSLPVVTWIRFLGWLNIGMFVYWLYGRRHSPLADRREQQARPAAVTAGDFVTMIGGLALFNGLCIALLAYMTEFGITTEVTAKWHEIGVTPESADVVGLQVLASGAVLLVIGRLIARGGQGAAAAEV
jgi:APA family basic amino acid/polyamine antiporter